MSSRVYDTFIAAPATPAARSRRWWGILALLATGDSLSVAAGFWFAYALRFWTNWSIFREGLMQPQFYLTLIVMLIPGWLVLFTQYGLYNVNHLFGGSDEYGRVFNACTLGMLLVVVMTFMFRGLVIARAWLLLSWLLTLGFTILNRFTMRRVVYALRWRGRLTDRVLIVGANGEGQAVAAQLNSAYQSGVNIVGFVDDTVAVGVEVLPGMPVLGPVAAFKHIVEQHGADVAIIADTALVRERMDTIYGAVEALGHLDLRLSPGLFELLTIGMQVREQGNVPLLALNKTRITGVHALGKNLLDRLGAFVGLLLLSPVLALIALLVRLDSPGPIIHRRRVVGVGNRPFDAYKFRTMHLDGDRLLTPTQRDELRTNGKLKTDPRITHLGKILRRTSLDELPQLLNVLKGQMSLVGPRMLTQEELSHFGRMRHNLLLVRPGLTGLWQISGRSDLGYADRVRCDMHYIRNYSLWLDFYIIYRTIPLVIGGHGAY